MTDANSLRPSDAPGDLAYLSATDALRLFSARRLSPVELLEAVIDRTEQVEPRINAFTECLFDQARAQAREAERRYLGKNGLAPRPLEGIPVALKEKHAIKGRTLTDGSLTNDGNIAAENSPLTDRVLEAGGIVHARTTTPEFSIATFTHSRMRGITRNPWNPDFTPGGSSGGSGASLAAARRCWRPVRTSAAPPGSRPRSTESSGSRRPTAATPATASSSTTTTGVTAPSDAPWMT